jgi:hypothetical protein
MLLFFILAAPLLAEDNIDNLIYSNSAILRHKKRCCFPCPRKPRKPCSSSHHKDRCHRYPPGPTGPIGPTGPAGPPLSANFGSFSLNLPVIFGPNQIVSTINVPFSSSPIGSQALAVGVNSDGLGTITVLNSGVYIITYFIEAQTDTGTSWNAVLLVNNVVENSMHVGATSTQDSPQTPSAQSVLRLENNSLLNVSVTNPCDLSTLTILNATINVVQIAQ